MVDVPAETPVITPVDEFTVATLGVPLVHDPPACVELKVVVLPVQTFCVPLNVPAPTGLMDEVKLSKRT